MIIDRVFTGNFPPHRVKVVHEMFIELIPEIHSVDGGVLRHVDIETPVIVRLNQSCILNLHVTEDKVNIAVLDNFAGGNVDR